MAQFIAINKDVEVNGETVLSIVAGMGVMHDLALSILLKNGIDNPKQGEWYSQQNWLNAFKQILKEIGFNTLFSIGKKIPENANFPPEINSLETALKGIDVAYHMNHRLFGEQLFDPNTGNMKEGIGHYNYKKIDETKAMMVCDNPYPCDFDRGIIEAMTKRFKPQGSIIISVTHDDSAQCRKEGANSCTYIVDW
ncbi:MAG: hypothetical protein SVZ03_12600 [Spirochaetota bacterium]|nr:hypothetical protein [Spirochaetota bacterium]